MNLFARILSHGFAIAIVLLLAIGLIYRGELFPGLELPEFLSLGTQDEGVETATDDSITLAPPVAEPVAETVPPPVAVDVAPVVTPEVEPSAETEISGDAATGEPAQPEAPAAATETPDDVPVEEPAAPEVPQTVTETPVDLSLQEPSEPELPAVETPVDVSPEQLAAPEVPAAVAEIVAEEPPAAGYGSETETEEPEFVIDSAVPGAVVPAAALVTQAVEPAAATDPVVTMNTDSAADLQAVDTSVIPAAVHEEAVPEPAPVPESVDIPGAMAPETAVLPDPAEAAAAEPVAEMANSTAEVAAPAVDTDIAPTTDAADTAVMPQAEAPDSAAAQLLPPAEAESEQLAQPGSEPVSPAAPQPELMAPVEPLEPAPTSAAAVEASPYEVLAAAREAFWLRDYEAAESKYRQLTAMEPDNPDGYGELGNMYFSQGMWDKAASSYFEAGTRLVKEGELEQARQLVDVIRGLDGTQADELDKQIAAAQAATH